MFIFLSKFLPPLIYPLGLSCGLIVLGLLLARRPKFQRWALFFAVGILWIGGNRWVSYGLTRSLEWQYLPPETITSQSAEPIAEMIVLLAGGTHSAQYPRPLVEVNGAGDRVIYAAYLYHQQKAPYILLSGGRIDWMESGDSPAQDMAVLLNMLGVPRQALLFEDQSRNTAESAIAVRDILSEKNIQRIILVTSAQHMPRSVALFEAQGFEIIPAPTDFTTTQDEWERLTHPDLATFAVNLIPEAGNLSVTTTCLKEYLGIFVYWLRGQV
jgi:uncharacterized SAM-binding protein YcdF (DUF218 family)